MGSQETRTTADEIDQYVNESYVAAMTGLSAKTLRNHRSLGIGIPFVKVGRVVRYFLPDVHSFIKSNTERTTRKGRGAAHA